MTLTLLLDLDDTLLASRMEEVFLPAYFKALSTALAEYIPPERMLSALMRASEIMLRNADPAHTLQEVFDTHFFPALGIERAALQPILDRFYTKDFQALRRWTARIEDAVGFVEWAFAQGFHLTVATNPIFPYLAQEARVRWAGLEPDKFSAITSYENWHFSKFLSHYYAETLLQIGWDGGPVLMVGDDAALDLHPAKALGIPTFWVGADDRASKDGRPIGSGSLTDLQRFLEVGAPLAEPQIETPSQILIWLLAVPAALQGRLQRASDAVWAYQPDADTWCVTEIICHLRDVEREVNIPRVERIASQSDAFIKATPTDEWVQSRNYAAQNGRQALTAFTAARKNLVDKLQRLPPEHWERKVRHSIFGRTTLREMMQFVLRHDREHLKQVEERIDSLSH